MHEFDNPIEITFSSQIFADIEMVKPDKGPKPPPGGSKPKGSGSAAGNGGKKITESGKR